MPGRQFSLGFLFKLTTGAAFALAVSMAMGIEGLMIFLVGLMTVSVVIVSWAIFAATMTGAYFLIMAIVIAICPSRWGQHSRRQPPPHQFEARRYLSGR